MTTKLGPVALMRLAAGDQPKLLLEAYVRGRYAAQSGFRTDNPYRDQSQMAAAWQKGWESADRG